MKGTFLTRSKMYKLFKNASFRTSAPEMVHVFNTLDVKKRTGCCGATIKKADYNLCAAYVQKYPNKVCSFLGVDFVEYISDKGKMIRVHNDNSET